MPALPHPPLNREPPLSELVQSFITPTKDAYDRNHCLHPELDGSAHLITIDGAVTSQLSLAISDLETDFKQHTVVSALQCAGNRRHTMRTQLKEVNGVDWLDGAVMNCKWTGPRLADILSRAGVTLNLNDGGYVAFACCSTPCEDDTWYGSSIPLARAMDRDMDVILALKVNDEPLSVGRGYPVRVIIPGIAGARAVKWLDCVTVQEGECENHYMTNDYKILPEEAVDAEAAEKFWRMVEPIQDMSVNSVVGVPGAGSVVERDADGVVHVQGYALPGGADGPIVKVEISGDDGQSWQDADLVNSEGESKWSWKLWSARLKMETGTNRTILSRATDAGGNTQPRQSQWNLRGICYNGYGDSTNLTVK